METIGFQTIRDEFEFNREKKCIEKEDDIVIVVAGGEGSGKSCVSLALGEIDKNFYDNTLPQVFYEWREYKKANTVAVQRIAKTLPKKIIKLVNAFGLNDEHYDTGDSKPLEPGAFLDYDEAGTQMYARDYSSKANKDQVKMFISNRFARLMHTVNVPKIGSLDKYIREERIKYFIWIDAQYTQDLEDVDRTMYVWSKEAYMSILNTPYYWQLFTPIERLINSCPPDFRIALPNLRNKWIPKDFYDHYFAKKVLFNLKQLLDMDEEDEEAIEKVKRIDEKKVKRKKSKILKKLPQPDESIGDWCVRTGLGVDSFKKYKEIAVSYREKDFHTPT